MSLAEKKNLLNPSKTAPNREDLLWVKVFSEKVTARAPGTRDIIGVEKERVYTGDALSIKDLSFFDRQAGRNS